MWAAQHYKFDEPRNWLTSGGLGSMGFGLPAAIGAAAARPDSVVVDIDGDGSFVMNIQELATLHAENLPVKMFVLNNQHLGMVVQWEDRFYGANRGHTYLGSPDQDYAVTKDEADIFPDFVKICEGFRVPAERVVRKSDLPAAIHTHARPRRSLPPGRHVPAPGARVAHGARRRFLQGYHHHRRRTHARDQGHEDALKELLSV